MEDSVAKSPYNMVRKIERKLRRFQHLIHKETLADCNFVPSRHLVICNAGLVSGLDEELVYNLFFTFGQIENIILIPGKSYTFISYFDAESAEKAYYKYNGKLNIAQYDKPIYLLYVTHLPSIEIEKSWNELPPGLVILENFITPEEETLLTSLCSFINNHSETNSGQMKFRNVKHYGYEFRYDINNVDKNEQLEQLIPSECDFIWQRFHESTGYKFKDFAPDQLTINHYESGQGIPSHVDTHSAFEDPIVCLSLQSSIIMEFKKGDKHICVLLPQRSLCIMSKESRYDWTHGITPRKFDVVRTKTGYTSSERGTRISFTFRKVLKGPCTCMYKGKCDSAKNNYEINNNVAAELEKLHVHGVYEHIANHFSDTRHTPWPNVLDFVQSLPCGSILVDVGCGNGKYLGLNKNVLSIGCDTSFGLLNVCKDRQYETFAGNCLTIPLNSDIAEAVICIAVIHHLSTEERRLKSIMEIVRILRHEGQALIYVWAKDQLRKQEKTSYIKQDRKNRPLKAEITTETLEEVSILGSVQLPVHTNRTQFQHKDVLVPWKLNNQKADTFLRYYHMFEENELDALCRKVENVDIVRSYYDQGNFCVILQKKVNNK